MEGGTVYILQEFVFHVHCFCSSLHDLFFFGFGRGGYSTVLERASNESFLPQLHTVFWPYQRPLATNFSGNTANREPRKLRYLVLQCRHVCSLRVSNFKTWFLLLVIYGSALQPEINPIDLQFGHISHVVTSVCYLLVTILNIKYKFWENLSCLISEQLQQSSYCTCQLWNKSYMSRLSKHGMQLLNCKRIKQAGMAVNSTLVFMPWLSLGFAQFSFSVTFFHPAHHFSNGPSLSPSH